MDEKLTHVDPRPIGSDRHPAEDWRALIPPNLRATEPPTTEPPIDKVNRWLDEPVEPFDFATLLLALGIAFALIGVTRLAWNLYESDFGVWGTFGFYGFFILDKSMVYFATFGLFAIAAGVWRRAR